MLGSTTTYLVLGATNYRAAVNCLGAGSRYVPFCVAETWLFRAAPSAWVCDGGATLSGRWVARVVWWSIWRRFGCAHFGLGDDHPAVPL